MKEDIKMSIFTGAGVAIITPMNEDGSINYDELGRIIENQIAGGTDAIIICGTTGESSTMNDEEHIKCIKYAVDKTAKRIPVIAGTGLTVQEKQSTLLNRHRKLVQTDYYVLRHIIIKLLRVDYISIIRIFQTQ